MVKNFFEELNKIKENKKAARATKNANQNQSIQNGQPKSFKPNSKDCREIKRVGTGLKNLGNTCFLNATLQCLLHTPPLLHFLLSQEHDKSCTSKKFCIVCELKKLAKSCFSGGSSAVAPQGIIKNLKSIAGHLRHGRQEDAHEFLRYLIDSAHKSSKKGKEISLIEKIFQGQLENQIKCMKCKHVSKKLDPFLDICIDVKNTPSIEVGLQKFTAPEILRGNNAYECLSCKKKVEASKKFVLHRLPRVLTLQLKRYSPFGGKVSSHVSFTENLDMSPYTSGEAGDAEHSKYRLYGVLVHDGGSIHSGHYYCYVRGSNTNWFCMNDSWVSQSSLQSVLKAQAYILFYMRSEIKELEANGTSSTKQAPLLQNGTKRHSMDSETAIHPSPSNNSNTLKPSKSLDSLSKTDFERTRLHLSPAKDPDDPSKKSNGKTSPPCSTNGLAAVDKPSPAKLLSIPSEKHCHSNDCKPVIDLNNESPCSIHVIQNGLSPQKSLTPSTNDATAAADKTGSSSRVEFVSFTSRWRVETINERLNYTHDDTDAECISTCKWKVEPLRADVRPVAPGPPLVPAIVTCPTFDWDKRREVTAEVMKDREMEAEEEEELSKMKLTYGRQILTWDDTPSLMDAADDRSSTKRRRSRMMDEYEEELDRGKVRKFKKKPTAHSSCSFREFADKRGLQQNKNSALPMNWNCMK